MRWPGRHASHARQRGSVLVIVLWIAIGLVSITLYFAHSMSFELRASDNRVAGLAADQAIEGAARYVSFVLANLGTNGSLPDLIAYQREAVPLGDARFWLIGRETNLWQNGPYLPTFGLVDEGSKLNLNTATAAMLEYLPRMTPELAAAIVDWRDSDSTISPSGAESETYGQMRPAYQCKNANFETTDELRLVAGATMEILSGEDANLNGIIDANENDGDTTLPYDNRDSRLDPGLLEYVTVYSRESNTRSNGSARIDISAGAGGGGGGSGGGGGGGGQSSTQLASLLQTNFGVARANEILARLGTQPIGSALEFYLRSQMKLEEFELIANDLTVTNSAIIEGRINVNTASAAVLACIPGIGYNNAPALVSYRLSNSSKLATVAWVSEVLDPNSAIQAGPYLTTQSYQFTADIAAVGPYGRGYRRTRFVFDTSEGTPKILYRQDLDHLGWALGRDVRDFWLLAKDIR